MQYITLDECVAEAMLLTPNVTDADSLIAKQWAVTALYQTGTCEDEIEVCEILPKNLIAKKPDNCRQLVDVACYDENDCFIPSTMRSGKKRIFPNTEIVTASTNSDGETEYTYSAVDLSEDRFNIILGTNATDVYKIKIRYFAYPIDKTGFPLIREDEKLACIYYIRFAKLLKEGENQSAIAQAESMWLRECDRARAAKKASGLTNAKAKHIASLLNRMIPNFNRSQF